MPVGQQRQILHWANAEKPLLWMVDRATDDRVLEHPLKLYPYNSVNLQQNVDDVMHSERDTFPKSLLFSEGMRTWDPTKCGKPIIHASVLERTRGIKGAEGAPYHPWILERFKQGEFEIEPWANKGMEMRYGLNIELGYRRNRNRNSQG